MAQEFGQVELGESNGKRVICACVEGNKHAVGLRIVADAFELNGWDVMFLGPDLPSKELIQQVSKSLPDMLCLSASMPEHLPVAKAAILEIHKALGNKAPAIMLGGLAVNAFSAISDEIGANLTASDAEKALTASLK
jgi:methanogenic corrinoid protein MtbC1